MTLDPLTSALQAGGPAASKSAVPQLPIAQFLLGLLGTFGLVLGVATLFGVVYRRHLRRLRREQRSLDPLTALSQRRVPLPFPPPPRWLAIRSSNTVHLRTLLCMDDEPATSWSEALARCREPELFLSPPVQGWSLVIGASLPDPSHDIDRCHRFLTGLSAEIGEVQFFATDRVLNVHTWARLRDGRVVRGYSWSGETQWNEGKVSLDERLLGLRSREYGDEAEPPAYGEVSPEQTNSERVILLARRWSIDPIAASEVILQQEQLASPDEDREPDNN